MPIDEEGRKRIHHALTVYASGGRPRAVKNAGEVTDEQFASIKAFFGKKGRKFKHKTIDILAVDIIHYYNSKIERDGMSVDEVVNIIASAFDANASVVPTASNRLDRAVLVNGNYHGVVRYTKDGTISVVTATKK